MTDSIEFRGVSKTFQHGSDRKLLGTFLRGLLRRQRGELFYALSDVSFHVRKGEGLGIIGSNGAGKSTLLALASGICEPDAGEVRVDGKIASVLDLGSGFHPLLSGRENLRLNASLLGFSPQRVDALYDDIVDFSEMEAFIDDPMRSYSSGMAMRLAFAVAVHLDPDIVILDEVFAVGDAAFQEKCRKKMMSLRKQGKTILCASHSRETVAHLCDRGIWLDHGRIVREGPATDVLDAYFGSSG